MNGIFSRLRRRVAPDPEPRATASNEFAHANSGDVAVGDRGAGAPTPADAEVRREVSVGAAERELRSRRREFAESRGANSHLGSARPGLHASRGVCWYSWTEQTRSMERLIDFDFSFVLPGHGRPHRAPDVETMRAELRDLVARMKQRGGD